MVKLLVIILFAANIALSTGFDRLGNWNYGPNLRHHSQVELPLHWGVWVPMANYGLRFDWLEPLQANRYHGTDLGVDPRFLRWQVGGDISPYYALFSTALGFQFVKRVEMRLHYTNQLFFGSNVQMGMEGRDHVPNVRETWRADYIFNRIYQGSWQDQMQNFGFWMDFDLSFRSCRTGLAMRYTLIDISTNHDSKSYDFARALPVYSREFVAEFNMYSAIPVHERWDVLLTAQLMTTGWIRDLLGNYTKEPLRQLVAFAGPTWWPNGRDKNLRLQSQLGFWDRPVDQSRELWTQRLIFQLGMEYAWELGLSL